MRVDYSYLPGIPTLVMNNEKNEIESLLMDESFINFCNRSSVEDIKYWEDYIKNNPQQSELIENAKDFFSQLYSSLATTDLEEQTSRLISKMNVTPIATVVKMDNPVRKKRYAWFTVRVRVAVLAVLLVGVGIAYYQPFKSSRENYKIFEAAYGERKNVQLPDGSFVTLNSGSSIKIKDDFGSTSREICLKGEAFFDVKHNPALPFIVHTKAMDIRALGTAFNVKAYLNESITEASLIRGVVEVTLKEDKNSKTLLYPNEKIKWNSLAGDSRGAGCKNEKEETAVNNLHANRAKEKVSTTTDGVIKEIAWKANQLVFEDERLEEIALLLERWYAVKVNFKDTAIRNYRFTGMFEKEELGMVLDFLKESRNFNYSIEYGQVTTVNFFK